LPDLNPNYSIAFAALALVFGMVIGVAANFMSRMMYAFEDLFERSGIHWMWWPAIGGLAIGIGGLFFPRGLGVGYDNIAELLRGDAPLGLLFGILIAKSLMWASSLGSGTSGGVLAPLLMIGGSMGALVAHYTHQPVEQQALWALLGMGAMLAGSLGVPLTAILFSLEITHSWVAIVPLTVSCIGAYLITSLIMPRSILTEKITRRGYHLTREYGVDPLELVMVRDRMVEAVDNTVPAVFVFSDATCRDAAEIMATERVTTLSVVDREANTTVGTLNVEHLLFGRRKAVQREQERLRLIGQ
jgi:H+/Cl- antiporter ClcA